MASETLLVATRDNHVIALTLDYANAAEKARKTLALRRFYESKSYNEFFNMYNDFCQDDSRFSATEQECLDAVDGNNTNFLERELVHYDFSKQPQNFVNELEQNNFPPAIAQKPDTVHFDHRIPSVHIPQLFKNLGFSINAEDLEYNVVYDSLQNKYEIVNFQTRRATVFCSTRKINWVRNHFTFPPAAYQRLQTLLRQYEAERQANPALDIINFRDNIADSKDRSLFNIYATEYVNVRHRELTLRHEFQHLKSNILEIGASLKEGAKRLSVEDVYRLQVEDERSSYLTQIVEAANKYMKQGNPSDFSMFDGEGSSFSYELAALPPNQRFAYASDIKNLLKNSFAVFAREHRVSYDQGQFVRNMTSLVDKLPLSAAEDANREEFRKIRSLYYRMQLYNPATGRMEEKNFASEITPDMEVQITQDNYDNIINPAQAALRRRLAEYNRSLTRGEINPRLVEEAKRLMRDAARTPRFINRVDDLEISDLFQDAPQQPQTPQQPQIPNDRAGWSDELQQYWQQQEGYQELAKNNLEYAFKVKEDTVRYTAVNKVQLNSDAQYETYRKLLNEPKNKNKPVKFKENLTEEQALKLYVACVVAGRRMTGAVPQDLSGINRLRDIPAADMQQFRQRTGGRSSHTPTPASRRNITNMMLTRNFSR